MKATILAILLSAGLAAPVIADAAAKTLTPAQQRMKDCNAEAKDKALKGDERKSFMSTCLKAEKDKQAAQRQKMKDCNAEAKTKALKGDERKAFMSTCLSG